MNKNIDLTKILKDCPKGTIFWSKIYGKVAFEEIKYGDLYPILIIDSKGWRRTLTKNGKVDSNYNDGECLLVPSKDQQDWSKFAAPWYKKDKFDPKTLQPFDKVLVRANLGAIWFCTTFSHIRVKTQAYPYHTSSGMYPYCIPYNEYTKNLAGTEDEAPEYYRYWEI